MKIILSIIIMFLSTQSFSGELDGKGLDCDVKVIESTNKTLPIGRISNQVWWFNNNTVKQANVRYDGTTGGFNIKPKDATLDNPGNSVNITLYESHITWTERFTPTIIIAEVEVNRKTLEMTNTFYGVKDVTNDIEKKPISVLKGKCKVFSGFDYVKKYQEKRKAILLKSLEDNKI